VYPGVAAAGIVAARGRGPAASAYNRAPMPAMTPDQERVRARVEALIRLPDYESPPLGPGAR
jgi:hypothetical protein